MALILRLIKNYLRRKVDQKAQIALYNDTYICLKAQRKGHPYHISQNISVDDSKRCLKHLRKGDPVLFHPTTDDCPHNNCIEILTINGESIGLMPLDTEHAQANQCNLKNHALALSGEIEEVNNEGAFCVKYWIIDFYS